MGNPTKKRHHLVVIFDRSMRMNAQFLLAELKINICWQQHVPRLTMCWWDMKRHRAWAWHHLLQSCNLTRKICFDSDRNLNTANSYDLVQFLSTLHVKTWPWLSQVLNVPEGIVQLECADTWSDRLT